MMTRDEALSYSKDLENLESKVHIDAVINKIYDEFENQCNHDYKEFTRTVELGETLVTEVYQRCTSCLKEKE